jgi:hypothetical protein
VVTPVRDGSEAALPTRADPALLKALARAFRYQRLLDEGRYASISEMAAAERIERGYLGSLLRLTLLAPDIVEAILGGPQPHALTDAFAWTNNTVRVLARNISGSSFDLGAATLSVAVAKRRTP